VSHCCKLRVAALHDVCRYRDDRQVMSVAAKLKKFHTVLQECGGVRMGLQDLLVKPGQHLTQLMEKVCFAFFTACDH